MKIPPKKEISFQAKKSKVKTLKKKTLKRKIFHKLSFPKIGYASWYNFIPGNYCASRYYKKGTKLLVENLYNGKKILVVVNDYGPFVKKRIIDLERSAFQKLAPLSQGVIKVKVRKID